MENEKLKAKIIELWHTSRCNNVSRYDRMIYVRDWLKKESPELVIDLSAKKIWFAIEDAIS